MPIQLSDQALLKTKAYINGQWVDADSGETVAVTNPANGEIIAEVAKCTREDIRINTFVLDVTHYLRNFVEQISRMNGGRAFFTTNEDLGDYLLYDFVDHKRSMVRGRR